MKRFELNMTSRRENGSLLSFDKIEADDLVQLMTQFVLVIAGVARGLLEEAKLANQLRSDDIPF